jgi:DNA polymerase-1
MTPVKTTVDTFTLSAQNPAERQIDVYEQVELPLQKVMVEMMVCGFPIDRVEWASQIEAAESRLEAKRRRLTELVGSEPNGPEWKFGSYNRNTKEENRADGLLALHRYADRLEDESAKAGILRIPNVQEKTLENYLATHGEDEMVRGLLEFLRTKSEISRNKKYLNFVGPDGRVHPLLASYGAETGRIQSKHPDIFNLEESWRWLVRDPYWISSIVSADLNQIELRILARYSGDPELLKAFLPGTAYDLHTQTARDATGKTSITKKERKLAKMVNFGICYGATVNGTFARLRKAGEDVTDGGIERFFAAFKSRFGVADAWQKEYGSEYSFVTESLLGRRRLVDPHRYGPGSGNPNREERLNAPIQSTGSDIMKVCLLRLFESEPEFARILFPHHDAVIVEVDGGQASPERIEATGSWLEETMGGVVASVLGEDYAHDVVEVSITEGGGWGEAPKTS